MTSSTHSERAHLLRASAVIYLFFMVLILGLFVLPTPETAEAAADGSAAADSSEAKSGEDDFAIVGARVFDGDKTWPSADVWVADGRIKAIDTKLELPDGIERIDGADHTLLPGLIDAHTHSWGSARADAVRFGVTSLLDQFTAPSEVQRALKDREAGGSVDQADLFSAGFLATADGGHGTQYGIPVPTVDSAEQASEWVAARKKEGSDWMKIVVENGWRSKIPTLDMERVGAVIEAAHEQDLLAVVHVSALDDALAVVDLGADGLVHVWSDRLPTDDEVAKFKDAGVFVVPTLVVFEGMVDKSPSLALAEGSLNKGISSLQQAGLEQGFPPGIKLDFEIPRGSVRRLMAAGVPILAGSDAPNPATAMGFSLHRELQLLSSAGLSNEQVLKAGTSLPAQHFDVADRGRLTVGALADMVLVAGDATADLESLQKLERVWKAGQAVGLEAPTSEVVGAAAPEQTLVADFADGLVSKWGAGWSETTDQMMGGSSTVTLEAVDEALKVAGEIKAGSMFPWSGAMVFFGEAAMEPVDLSSRKQLQFRVRGDGRKYTAMLFSGAMQGIPPSLPFTAGSEWQTVTLDLEDFAGADLAALRAVAFTANAPAGTFEFVLDDVELR